MSVHALKLTLIKNHIISQVEMDSRTITFLFREGNRYTSLILKASTVCCEACWFEEYNDYQFESMIGKSIVDIVPEQLIDLPPSGRQEYDINNVYLINLSDESEFRFLMRASSNGYYEGWLSISYIENTNYSESEQSEPSEPSEDITDLKNLVYCHESDSYYDSALLRKSHEEWERMRQGSNSALLANLNMTSSLMSIPDFTNIPLLNTLILGPTFTEAELSNSELAD